MRWRYWLMATFTLAMTNSAYPGDFDVLPSRGTIAFSGRIEAGDTERLVAILRKNRFHSLHVDSLGGSVDEAIRMAQVVKALYLGVRVTPGKPCASACFLLFLAGSGRGASPAEMMTAKARAQLNELNAKTIAAGLPPTQIDGFVGLHRPYSGNISNLENNQIEIMKKLTRYLEALMLPRRLIDSMMTRPSNDIYWLTYEDLQQLGDYPPEQEELFIKKCGYDRNYFNKLSKGPGAAKRNGALIAANDKAGECIVGITSDGREKAWRKLKEGWLPGKQEL